MSAALQTSSEYEVYEPSSDFIAKVTRRAARFIARDMVTPELDRGLVSFTFDDCPRSVMENALPALEAKGWSATIYAAIGLCGITNHLGLHMSETDIQAAHAAGHDIADHTFTHLNARVSGPDALLSDIERNKAAFTRLGLPPARSFAYPYGGVSPAVKRVMSEAFPLSRGVHTPASAAIDLALAPAARLYSSTIEETLEQIDLAAREKRWLILFGHDVRDNPSEFGCTLREMKMIIEAVARRDLDVLNVRDALDRINP